MSLCATTPDHQVVQVVSFTILNDSTFESRFSKEGRRWRKAMKTIRQQEGWLRTLYGRDLNSSHRIELYIAWTSLAVAEAFTSTSTFEIALASVAVSLVSSHYIGFQGMLAPQGPAEIMTLSFPSTLSHEDQLLFDHQLDHCKHAGPPIVHGWRIVRGWEAIGVPQECRVMFSWESLDEMYDVKSDQDSLFNNGFVPLRNEATEGSKAVLYMKLQDAYTDQPSCAIM